MHLEQLYKALKARLTGKGEALAILQHVLSKSEADVIADSESNISAKELEEIETILNRREAGEPLTRIFGVREFWGLEFEVTPDTLDPRPDTETLVEAVLKSIPDKKQPLRIADLGTGTGCILIALLSKLPNATGIGVDISEAALAVARRNAQRNGVDERAVFIHGSWLEPLKNEKLDFIVSNPPYIDEEVIHDLSPEVKNHDPHLALSGGKNGLECYKKIISQLKIHLNRNNCAFLEIGFDQMESVSGLVDDSNLCVCDSYADIAGIPRVVEICCGDK